MMLSNSMMMKKSGNPPPDISKLFRTTLYTGNNSSRTITTGIDLATPGGLIWIKNRVKDANDGASHVLFDTERTTGYALSTDLTNGHSNYTGYHAVPTTSGFSLAGNSVVSNSNADTFVAWSFARGARFFDMVKYTGNSTGGRTITHGLGVTPGLVIIKRVDTNGAWYARHRSASGEMYLNTIDQADTAYYFITGATSTTFTVGSNGDVNGSGGTYIAYLFAHDTAADGVIQCGSVTPGSAVNLGWQPQWILHRWHTQGAFWHIVDAARGMSASTDPQLYTSGANKEPTSPANIVDITSTGFTPVSSYWGSTSPVAYVAIRAS